jgi:hypothetical protein
MNDDKKVSEAAKEMSKKGAAKGGLARAHKLSPEKRSEIARKAVETRWNKKEKVHHNVPKATHQGVLKIGDQEIACAVLDDGTRVISRNAIFRAFGRTKRGRKKGEVRVLNMPSFIDANNLQPFVHAVFPSGLKTIVYQPLTGRQLVEAYEADTLRLMCDVYLTARQADAITKSQMPLASMAEILVRSFSKLGIAALVDEATGFQYDRQRDELEKLLAVYLSEEKLRWAKTFPDEFYKQIYRLKAWGFPGSTKRTPLIGKITNDIVYEKLPPGVLLKLRELNPKIENTHRRRYKFFQFLSEDIGQPDLRDHLLQVIAIMRAARNWKSFERLFDRAFESPNPKGKQGEIWPDDGDDDE